MNRIQTFEIRMKILIKSSFRVYYSPLVSRLRSEQKLEVIAAFPASLRTSDFTTQTQSSCIKLLRLLSGFKDQMQCLNGSKRNTTVNGFCFGRVKMENNGVFHMCSI